MARKLKANIRFNIEAINKLLLVLLNSEIVNGDYIFAERERR
jgi:hypothetical protein